MRKPQKKEQNQTGQSLGPVKMPKQQSANRLTAVVVNPQTASPHDITAEILLKQIEALQYKLRAQTSINSRLDRKLAESIESIAVLRDLVELQHQNIIRSKQTIRKLLACLQGSSSNNLSLRKMIKSLVHGEEWKPEVQQVIQAIKLPVCSN